MIIYIKKTLYLLVSLLCLSTIAFSQEAIVPMHSNPVIKKYLQEHRNSSSHSAARLQSTPDTLQLPFTDDFSYDGIYPTSDLWSDSDVFVNRDFPISPPTIGVATFDGLDKYGNPYNINATADDIADHLTSKYIHLNYPSDTTIWLSFFYEAGGNGYEFDMGPNSPEDSLRLEFYNPTTGAWNVVWNTPGGVSTQAMVSFSQAMINIRDTAYLKEGFRFRFSSIAGLNENADHWNLDYVRLNKNRSAADTTFVNEGAFLYRHVTILAPPYTSMPYSHYKTNPSLFTATSETVDYRNLSSSTLQLSHQLLFFKEDGITMDNSTLADAVNVNPFSIYPKSKSFSYVFPSLPQSSLHYQFWNINTVGDFNPQNDTVKEVQVLDNYYAYDDGTSEAAYQLTGTDNVTPSAQLAVKFDLKMQDTLRGVQIYWNRLGPDPSNRLINITVWSSINLGTNNDNLIYQLIDQKPANEDSINGFHTYVFDIPLIVSGTIYVGWTQNDKDAVPAGVDLNLINNNKILYNAQGVWIQSSIPGSMMIRPVLGSTLPVGLNETTASNFSATVFPNPVSDELKININARESGAYSFQLFNAIGELVVQQKATRINTSTLQDGLYVLKMTDTKTNQFFTEKVIVSHTQ